MTVRGAIIAIASGSAGIAAILTTAGSLTGHHELVDAAKGIMVLASIVMAWIAPPPKGNETDVRVQVGTDGIPRAQLSRGAETGQSQEVAKDLVQQARAIADSGLLKLHDLVVEVRKTPPPIPNGAKRTSIITQPVDIACQLPDRKCPTVGLCAGISRCKAADQLKQG